MLGPKEAALVTREYLKPRFVIPIHYGTTPVMTGTPAQYQELLGATATKVYPLKQGEKVEF